jgi:hypothetical protein
MVLGIEFLDKLVNAACMDSVVFLKKQTRCSRTTVSRTPSTKAITGVPELELYVEQYQNLLRQRLMLSHFANNV